MAINMSYFAGAGAQFFDDNGVPLAGGKLYTYSAGTTTPAVTYTTRAGTVNNTNPIILDAAGRTPNEIWFSGGLLYKFVLKSSTDVLIGTYDNISSINDVSQTSNLITVVGTNDLIGTSVVPVTAYSAGFQVSFVAVATNTGPMTIDIDATGAKSIVTDVSTPLAAGDVPIGKVVYLEYDGTRFQIINPAAFKNIRVAGVLNLSQGAAITSAATINLTTTTGNSVHVTGTTTITAITLAQGYQRTVIFDDVLTLTNSASLILPSGVNIVTANQDIAVFVGDAAGVVRCVSYSRQLQQPRTQSVAVSANGTNANVSITADQVALFDTANSCLNVRSVSLTINSAASGVNGLDTGAIAASTWYAVYVISNGTTTAGLLSTSATAPTMPSGYTFKTRIGWIRTDGTANKYPLGFKQFGRTARYVIGAATNVTSMPAMASGIQGSTSIPTWVAVAIANFVPPTASMIAIRPHGTSNTDTTMVAPNNSYGAIASSTNPPPISLYISGSGTVSAGVTNLILESTNIYVAQNGTTCYTLCAGWEDNL